MTIQEAISRADAKRTNLMSRREKIAALSELDGLIHREIILNHEHEAEAEEFAGYTEETDPDTELLAPFPYHEMYIYWLMQRIDDYNLEPDKRANDYSDFTNGYNMFHDWWRREHMPVQRNREMRI